ncbi:MAG: hypothetical protein HDQ88_11620 [Clostridia bacterium]|nr:hypothetical protein [Clostridia bacterium]
MADNFAKTAQKTAKNTEKAYKKRQNQPFLTPPAQKLSAGGLFYHKTAKIGLKNNEKFVNFLVKLPKRTQKFPVL